MTSIYKHFSSHTLLPIKLADIKSFILNTGEALAIARFPVDIDELALHGMLRVFRDRPPYATEDRVMAQIAYYKDLPEEYVRLVCTKEMLHLLDHHVATASTAEAVAQLVEEITLPIEAVASIPGLSDHTMLINALCVLIPKAAREAMKPAFDAGSMSSEDVARVAKIPEPFARLVMTDRWEELEHRICSV
jgi:hypothetical protein